MSKAFITGVAGMAGSYLLEYIIENVPDCKITACRRRHSDTTNIDHLLKHPNIEWTQIDLIDGHEIEEVIKWYEPEKIFHLAAQSFVPRSWKAPVETTQANVIGTINLLEACRKYAPNSVVHLACSSEEYGMVYPSEVPIKETNPLRPLSPYGATKVMQENLGVIYNRSYGLKTVITRAFNHTGPRRGEDFVTAQIAKQTAEIYLGMRDAYLLGNLEAKRDFTDVRDMVWAYWLATEKCDYGEAYNVCSGITYTIAEVVHMAKKYAEIKAEVRQDRDRMRPADVPILLGDCTKFKEKTGWHPRYTLETTLQDMIDHWVEKLSGKPTTRLFIN